MTVYHLFDIYVFITITITAGGLLRCQITNSPIGADFLFRRNG